MSKSKMSKNFARFAKNTTSGKFDEVRKAERTARGIPFAAGDKGTAVAELICGDKAYKDNPDETYPLVEVHLTVSTPESGKGTVLKDPLNLTWYIKDSDKEGSDWTAEDAWGSMLQDLERLGVPNELTSGYEDFQEILDWFDKEPRTVNWEVEYRTNKAGDIEMYRGRKQTQVLAYAQVEEGSKESADEGDSPDFPEGTKFVEYRGVKYGVIEELEDDLVKIRNCQTGKDRTVAKISLSEA